MPQSPLVRRLINVPAVIIGLVLLLVLSPVLIVGAVIFDLITGKPKLPTLRLGIFAALFLVHDWIVVGGVFGLWLYGLTGRNQDFDAHRRLQGWVVGSIMNWARRLLNVRVDLGNLDDVPSGRVIVLSRHASMIDAMIPIYAILSTLRRPVHYVLKQELQWDPIFDFLGNKVGNHFVERSGRDTDTELDAILELSQGAIPNSGLVIFPEGTYATPANRERVLASLERKGELEHLARARKLDHLLPPKPAGTLSMLAGQPDVDVVVCGHVGAEGVAELAGLRSRLPLEEPVVVRWWHHRRDELPDDEDGMTEWLYHRWAELDEWVEEATDARLSPDRTDR